MKTQYRISILDPDAMPTVINKVWGIKQLRTLAGVQNLGMKRAKEMIEFLRDNPTENVVIDSDHHNQVITRGAIDQLGGINISVEPVLDETLMLIKQAALAALEMGNHTLARDLTAVLVTHGGN